MNMVMAVVKVVKEVRCLSTGGANSRVAGQEEL